MVVKILSLRIVLFFVKGVFYQEVFPVVRKTFYGKNHHSFIITIYLRIYVGHTKYCDWNFLSDLYSPVKLSGLEYKWLPVHHLPIRVHPDHLTTDPGHHHHPDHHTDHLPGRHQSRDHRKF